MESIHRIIAVVALFSGVVATVAWTVAALVSRSPDMLWETIGPIALSSVAGWTLVTHRLRGDLILAVAAVHVIVTVTLSGRQETMLAASVGLIVIFAVGGLLVDEGARFGYLIGTVMAATAAGVLWGEDDRVFMASTLGLLTAVTVGLFMAVHGAARTSELRYRTLFHSVPVPLVLQDWRGVAAHLDRLESEGVADISGYLEANPEEFERIVTALEIVDSNDAFVTMMRAPDAAAVTGHWDASRIHDGSRDYLLRAFDQLREGVQSGSREWESKDWVGDPRWLRIEWRQMPEGSLPDADRLVAVHDVTDLKNTQHELSELLDEKDHLVASISHELRTPLTAVLGFAELLEGSGMSESEMEEIRAMLIGEARSMSDIIEDLLVAARARMGAIAVRPEKVDLVEVATRVVKTARGEFVMPDLMPVWANADASRVAQVVRNLVTNSIKYGGAHRRVLAGSDEQMAWVEVRDDGRGVSEELAARVFEPYVSGVEQVGLAPSMGLGLWVSRQLAEAMDGDLLYTRDGDETVFRLTLPPV